MLRCDVLERADMAVTKLQISPLIFNGFKNGFHQWIQHIFLVVVGRRNLFSTKKFFDAFYRPVAAKPFVLEDFVLGMGTSVASALSAETIFEIMKCIADVDMPARVRMGSKSEIFRFFNFGYAHDRNNPRYCYRKSSVRPSVHPWCCGTMGVYIELVRKYLHE